MKFGSLSFKSLSKKDVLDLAHGDHFSYLSTNILNSDLNIDTPLSYQISDLYDHYKIDLCDAEVRVSLKQTYLKFKFCPSSLSVDYQDISYLELGSLSIYR